MNDLIKIAPYEIDGKKVQAGDAIAATNLLHFLKDGSIPDEHLCHTAIAVAALEINKIVRCAYESKDVSRAMDLLEKVKKDLPCIELSYLCDAVLTHLFWQKQCYLVNEKDVENYFYKNIDSLLPNSKKVSHSTITGHYPDGFVSINGQVAPVEIKRDVFTYSSLAQLRRYMNVYGANSGIAVAPKIKCAIPKGVKGIEINIEDVIASKKASQGYT